MNDVLKKLKGGDLRSIGKSDEVVQDVLNDPSLFKQVFDGVFNDDPVIRMRSADVLEKVSRNRPDYLQPFKSRLVNEVSKITQKEVQWHVAQMFSYIEINKEERHQIMDILFSYINESDSQIVKTFAMQTLADFAERDPETRLKIMHVIKAVMRTGGPAVKSRGRKLIMKLREKTREK